MAQLDLVVVGPELIDGPTNAKIMNQVEKHGLNMASSSSSCNDQVPEQIMLHFPTEIGAILN